MRKKTNQKRPSTRINNKNANSFWIYGKHAVLSALNNPNREASQLLITKNLLDSLPEISSLKIKFPIQISTTQQLSDQLPGGAVHQGIALQCNHLPETSFDDFLNDSLTKNYSTLLILDQITDPHNVGAIFRSAAAFEVDAVITTERHTASEGGVLAKSASGALDLVPFIKVTNLATTIKELKKYGYWVIGLGLDTELTLGDIKPANKRVLILGSEDTGMRRLTREHCDSIVKLPMSSNIDSLNVSNAAAIGLYELYKQLLSIKK